jgi:hypothetical protein
MNTEEHLQRIKAKCKEMISAFPPCESVAGWQSTIAAIDSVIADDPRYQDMYFMANEDMIKGIIAAWPEELL